MSKRGKGGRLARATDREHPKAGRKRAQNRRAWMLKYVKK